MTDLDDRLRSDRLLPAWLLYMASDPIVRVWTGAGPFKLGASGPDTAGGTYKGLGLLTGVPSLRLPINGASAQHVFTVSGVDAAMIRLVEADRDSVRNARIAIARLELNPDGTPLGDPLWLWQGQVDTTRMVRDGSTSPATYTVSLVAVSGALRRKVRRLTYYTGPQQRERDGTDTACDGTAQLQAGETVIWPT